MRGEEEDFETIKAATKAGGGGDTKAGGTADMMNGAATEIGNCNCAGR